MLRNGRRERTHNWPQHERCVGHRQGTCWSIGQADRWVCPMTWEQNSMYLERLRQHEAGEAQLVSRTAVHEVHTSPRGWAASHLWWRRKESWSHISFCLMLYTVVLRFPLYFTFLSLFKLHCLSFTNSQSKSGCSTPVQIKVVHFYWPNHVGVTGKKWRNVRGNKWRNGLQWISVCLHGATLVMKTEGGRLTASPHQKIGSSVFNLILSLYNFFMIVSHFLLYHHLPV